MVVTPAGFDLLHLRQCLLPDFIRHLRCGYPLTVPAVRLPALALVQLLLDNLELLSEHCLPV